MRLIALLFAFVCCLAAAPADIAGKWNLTATDPDGNIIKAELELQQNGGTWTGTISSPEGSTHLRDVSFKDGVLACALDYEGADVTLNMKLNGDTLKGRYEANGGPSGPVEASRMQKSASIAGVWNLTTIGPDGDSIKLQLTMKRDGDTWKGTIVSDSIDATLELEDVKIDGEIATFRVPTPIGAYKVTATITENKFTGTAIDPDGVKNPIQGGR